MPEWLLMFLRNCDGKMRVLIKISFYEFLIKNYSFFRIKRFFFYFFFPLLDTHPIPIYVHSFLFSRVYNKEKG